MIPVITGHHSGNEQLSRRRTNSNSVNEWLYAALHPTGCNKKQDRWWEVPTSTGANATTWAAIEARRLALVPFLKPHFLRVDTLYMEPKLTSRQRSLPDIRQRARHDPPLPSESKNPKVPVDETYLPQKRRRGIGICLSGGGYRATLFHLGALRRLKEVGLLTHPELRTISSVSGGSITSAQLATAMARHPQEWLNRWEEFVEKPLQEFTRTNIRTKAISSRLYPWNWNKSSAAVEALEKQYEKRLTNLRLRELPPSPEFAFCATELGFGVNWEFQRDQVTDYQLGQAPTPEEWTVAKAVAASSCFPPIFNPMRIPAEKMKFRGGMAWREEREIWNQIIKSIPLNDGGNYDNLGTEPVWKDHELVIVSDGGGLFKGESDRGLLWRVQRYVAVVQNQARALRKRWLISNFKAGVMEGAYFGVGSARSRYGEGDTFGYSKAFAKESLAEIRTDLDAFSEIEAGVLMNHGYLLADKAIHTHVAKRWLPSEVPPVQVPHPKYLSPEMPEADLATVLLKSRKQTLLGRR